MHQFETKAKSSWLLDKFLNYAVTKNISIFNLFYNIFYDILRKHRRYSCPILLHRSVSTLFRQEHDLSRDALEMEITEFSFNNLIASGTLSPQTTFINILQYLQGAVFVKISVIVNKGKLNFK